ncbi:tRNA dimethylallyltransferase [Scopulibacillus darangshiensis]|uniref:tRNA dimethylallyltransferase n=1 Tax=Scopulibacillus darangshiensis TaxID=442528 RepID=A0A4R2P607_9BACL|nr:tRNA (adenosine(37)-N6)-dimethylallyltransferase MiaA [Scopulibacillus darangshiensis]TCP30253.1 tRNA dimethylallyltransferase [Scopulibacillus darangshiensis]
MKEKVVIIVGPTAVGKTKLSLDIARVFNGEVINGDAMQVYQGLNIGTAKIPETDMQGIPHHLIDFLPPSEPYTVAAFQSDARQLIHDLNEQHKCPVLVGGTGLYIKAAAYDYQFTDVEDDPDFRKEMARIAESQGNMVLHQKLADIDPVSARAIHPNNVNRVIRALEVYHLSGLPFSMHQQDQEPAPLFDIALIGLTMDRELLYKRINQRVDDMIEAGLIDEAKALYDSGIRNVQAVQAIGYKELYRYFEGECTLQEAVSLLKRNSRRFAKRQYTWFRNQMDVTWFDMTEALDHFEKKAEEIIRFVAGKLEIRSK